MNVLTLLISIAAPLYPDSNGGFHRFDARFQLRAMSAVGRSRDYSVR
jgi:hypothetical protein